MILIALLLLAAAVALIVLALTERSNDVNVEMFDVSIDTNVAEVFVAGVVTGLIALLAFGMIAAGMRRRRERREEIRDLRRRAEAWSTTREDTTGDRSTRRDDDAYTETREYPNDRV